MNIQNDHASLNQDLTSQSNFDQSRFTNLNTPPSLTSPLNCDIQSKFSSDLDKDQISFESGTNKKKKSTVRMRFTPQEDQELARLVSVHGDQDWNKISAELSKQSQNVKRTPRQCRDRYVNYLSPEIKNSEWTVEEDQCLILHYLLTPYHWRSMTNLFPGRSEVSIKNRFNHLYKDGMRLLRPMIDTNIPKRETNNNNANVRSHKPAENPPNSNETPTQHNSCQFLQQYKNVNDLSGAPINLNSLKSVIKNLFHYDSFLFNQLFMNGQNASAPQQSAENNAADHPEEANSNTENRPSIFDNRGFASQQNNLDDILQLESDSEAFDPLAFLEMYQ